jgi:hypothetical protein
MVKKRIGIIVSNYSGPFEMMALLYAKGIVESNCCQVSSLVIAGGYENLYEIIQDKFDGIHDIKAVYIDPTVSPLLRPILSKEFRKAIDEIYDNNDLVISLWFPGAIMATGYTKIRKTIFLMCDSQVKLIKTTIKNLTFSKKAFAYLAYLCYSVLEFYISTFAYKAIYASVHDLNKRRKSQKNIIVAKLPLQFTSVQKKKAGTPLPKIILVPRPDIQLLCQFIKNLEGVSQYEIKVLLNSPIPSEILNKITHIKYIDNYFDFFKDGGIVALLDSGGAGMSNRSLLISSLGLPFVGTPDSIRGHEVSLPNCLLISNDMSSLARSVVDNIDYLSIISTTELDNYITQYHYSNAVIPIIDSIATFNRHS